MDELVISRLRDLYGLNPNIPHLALQFPRLPPSLFNNMYKIYKNQMNDSLTKNVETIHKQLSGFQQSYRQQAANLMHMNNFAIVPPGHPLYNRQNSLDTLKMENDKLLKENMDLKKKLEKQKD